ncbi:MAG TPA: hypothetical protein PKV72_01205 [Candidatus Peribacteria bacterium]|nr:hypothetical protein [Candidatus Peribacteria bacterium]
MDQERLERLESAIRTVELRNTRVEADKAWETSAFRKCTIAAMTYVVICAFLISMKVAFPFLHALVPVAGYLLSTVTLPPIKAWWLKRRG